MRSLAPILAAAALVASGCGGDDEDEPVTPPPPGTTQAEPAPTASAPETEPPQREPRRLRTPRSLAQCVRSLPGVSDVLVKGRDSEDARFFADIVGGRVDVLGVTLEGESAEVSVFLFASEADARKAAPSAGGGGVEARTVGSAVVAGPPGARADGIDRCVRATGYG